MISEGDVKLTDSEGFGEGIPDETPNTTGLSFSQAFERVKLQEDVGMRLPHWNEDVVIYAQYPTMRSKMTAPYLYVSSRFGKVPWKETMIELFSEEWEVV